MNYKTYQGLARRTESLPNEIYDNPSATYPQDTELDYRLDHACKGLTTEIAELKKSDDDGNMKEELGDILWYLDLGSSACGCTLADLPSSLVLTDKSDSDYLVIYNGDLMDLIKRRKFYNLKDPEMLTKYKRLLGHLLSHVISICTEQNFSLVEVMTLNIEKLSKRYPDKFSDHLAVNRDLDKEKQVFAE